tara:strand:+ start:2444 stop:2671 length:228 start_codon:yes stop_codon:yes gene_type:complete
MQRFDELILVIAGEDKSAIAIERLDVRSKEELNIVSGVIRFIDDDNFMLLTRCKRDCGSEVLSLVSYCVKESSLV